MKKKTDLQNYSTLEFYNSGLSSFLPEHAEGAFLSVFAVEYPNYVCIRSGRGAR
jgi:hypothetical protein